MAIFEQPLASEADKLGQISFGGLHRKGLGSDFWLHLRDLAVHCPHNASIPACEQVAAVVIADGGSNDVEYKLQAFFRRFGFDCQGE